MKPILSIILVSCLASGLSSCISKKKYMEAASRIQALKEDSTALASRLSKTNSSLENATASLEDFRTKNDELNRKLGSALAASSEQEQQITSKERTIEEQQRRLVALQALIDQQRSVMNRLKETVSRALNQYNSDELQVELKDGKVYVSLQDKLVFQSGSAIVNKDGQEALGKLAAVLNNNKDIQVTVEGHTDSIPMRGKFEDNWALSVARATSIVRILTTTYEVEPTRVIAAGHSSHDPRDSNKTPEGRAKNRRTEIILTPKLNELYTLLQQ
jgi:chemotaxis protein MotB